jgi:hypothetical protein
MKVETGVLHLYEMAKHQAPGQGMEQMVPRSPPKDQSCGHPDFRLLDLQLCSSKFLSFQATQPREKT